MFNIALQITPLVEKKYVSSVSTPFEETYCPAYTKHKTNCINNMLILQNFKHRLTTLHAAWTWCSVKTEIRSANILIRWQRRMMPCDAKDEENRHDTCKVKLLLFFFLHILTHHSSVIVIISDSLFHYLIWINHSAIKLKAEHVWKQKKAINWKIQFTWRKKKSSIKKY